MWLRSISAQATLMTGTLLLLAMLLVDFFVSSLWYYQATQARLARMQDILNSLAVPLAGGQSAGPLLERVPPDGAFCLYLLDEVSQRVLAQSCPLPAHLTTSGGPWKSWWPRPSVQASWSRTLFPKSSNWANCTGSPSI